MTQLKVLPTGDKRRNDDLVEKLEYLLDQAKTGDIYAILAIAIRPNNNFISVRSALKTV